MGFLSFLGRKPSKATFNGDIGGLDTQLLAQPYETTEAALPPIRGKHPVAGNAPNALEQLQQAAKKRRIAKLPVSPIDPSAPAPLVPRLRSHSVGKRSLASVDFERSSIISRPKSAGRTPSRGPPYFLGVKGPASTDSQPLSHPVVPPVPRIPDSHQRDGSSSVGSTKRTGHVDLLDASSAIRPADFHSRVKAAGARDYGEDVAERNIAINGVDLASPAVKAFYSLTGGAALAYRSDGSAVDVHGQMYAAATIPEELKNAPPPEALTSGELESIILGQSGARSHAKKSSNSSGRLSASGGRGMASISGHGQSSQDDPDFNTKTTDPSTKSRRSSMHEYMHKSSTKSSKPRPKSTYTLGNQASDPALPPSVPRQRLPSTSKMGDGKPTSGSQKDPRARSKSTSRDHHSYKHTNGDAPAKHRKSTPNQRHYHANFASKALVSDDGDVSSSPPSPPPTHRKRQMEHHNYSRPSSSQAWSNGLSKGERSNLPARPSTSASPQHFHPRSRSIGGASIPGRHKLDDIIEHIPVRTSSLGPVEPRMMSPTTSDSVHSSMGSHGESYHTGNTSVDLSAHSTGHRRGKSSGASSSRRIAALEEELLVERAAAHIRDSSGDFEIKRNGDRSTSSFHLQAYGPDDASDADSFVEKRRRQRFEDEALLMKNANYLDLIYGLPGLHDRHHQTASGRAPRASKIAGKGSQNSAMCDIRRSVGGPAWKMPEEIPSDYDYESEYSDSEFLSDFEYEELMRRVPAALEALAARDSNSRFGGLNGPGGADFDLFDLLDDMPTESMDSRTAAKVRKELKRHKRIVAQQKLEKSKGKQPMRPDMVATKM